MIIYNLKKMTIDRQSLADPITFSVRKECSSIVGDYCFLKGASRFVVLHLKTFRMVYMNTDIPLDLDHVAFSGKYICGVTSNKDLYIVDIFTEEIRKLCCCIHCRLI